MHDRLRISCGNTFCGRGGVVIPSNKFTAKRCLVFSVLPIFEMKTQDKKFKFPMVDALSLSIPDFMDMWLTQHLPTMRMLFQPSNRLDSDCIKNVFIDIGSFTLDTESTLRQQIIIMIMSVNVNVRMRMDNA